MCTEFLVDVVQMVAQGLGSDSETVCNLCCILTRRKRSKDVLFPLRKRRDRRRSRLFRSGKRTSFDRFLRVRMQHKLQTVSESLPKPCATICTTSTRNSVHMTAYKRSRTPVNASFFS